MLGTGNKFPFAVSANLRPRRYAIVDPSKVGAPRHRAVGEASIAAKSAVIDVGSSRRNPSGYCVPQRGDLAVKGLDLLALLVRRNRNNRRPFSRIAVERGTVDVVEEGEKLVIVLG